MDAARPLVSRLEGAALALGRATGSLFNSLGAGFPLSARLPALPARLSEGRLARHLAANGGKVKWPDRLVGAARWRPRRRQVASGRNGPARRAPEKTRRSIGGCKLKLVARPRRPDRGQRATSWPSGTTGAPGAQASGRASLI